MAEGDLSSFGAGFPVLILLATLSVASIAILFAKLLELRGTNASAEATDRILNGGQPDGKAPAIQIAADGYALLKDGVETEAITLNLVATGNEVTAKLGRHIRTLEVVAMISPLLGLLGTVLGMIQSFQSLELAAGAANASVLAGGIWQALLTTAAGLLVAIPASVGAAYLAGRVERISLDIEGVIARVAVMGKNK